VKSEKNDHAMQELRPTVWIGKQGCTGTVVEEIIQQLEKRKIVKVKVLPNTGIDFEEVAARTGSDLIEVRGKTFVLTRLRKK
jgi:RNA-binding protein